MLLLGRVSLLRYFVYVIAQNLGAFLASVMVYLTYLYELENYPEGMYSLTTAGNIDIISIAFVKKTILIYK
jgi:glycerol uptake facilitator-like aquaporin